jgi:hypothetical protein
MTTKSIVELVYSKETAVAWLVHHESRWFGIVFVPDNGTSVMVGGSTKAEITRILRETEKETYMPLRIVEGVTGIAATDPAWNGSSTFICDNPACSEVHNVHEMVATNLIRRALWAA